MATLSHLTGDTFSSTMISQMEKKVLSALGWKLAPATTARFLDIFLKGYEKMWAAECAEEADLLFMRDRLGKLANLCILGKDRLPDPEYQSKSVAFICQSALCSLCECSNCRLTLNDSFSGCRRSLMLK